jgi:hypothetical protein
MTVRHSARTTCLIRPRAATSRSGFGGPGHRACRPAYGRLPHVVEVFVEILHGMKRPLDLDEHPPPSPSGGPRQAAVPATKMSPRLSQGVQFLNLSRHDYDARFDLTVYTSSRFLP